MRWGGGKNEGVKGEKGNQGEEEGEGDLGEMTWETG